MLLPLSSSLLASEQGPFSGSEPTRVGLKQDAVHVTARVEPAYYLQPFEKPMSFGFRLFS